MNEWKRLLAEIKNIKLNTNNNVKQYIHQRCYQVTNNSYGNPKSLINSSLDLLHGNGLMVLLALLTLWLHPHGISTLVLSKASSQIRIWWIQLCKCYFLQTTITICYLFSIHGYHISHMAIILHHTGLLLAVVVACYS